MNSQFLLVTKPDADAPRNAAALRVDCRGRSAREVFLQVLPACLEAGDTGSPPVLAMMNLALLQDSVIRLLKSLDRLAGEIGARIKLQDSSGLSDAFLEAMVGGRRPEADGNLERTGRRESGEIQG